MHNFIVLIPKSEIITEFLVIYETTHPANKEKIYLKAHVLGNEKNPRKEKLAAPLISEIRKLIATKFDILFIGKTQLLDYFHNISDPIIHAIFSYNDIGQKSLALRENFETSTLEDLGLESLLKDYHIPIIQKVEEAIQRKNYLASHGDVVLII
jgi:hypothetical protein